MSVINTPPKNRLPIKTFVGEWNENMVKNAIIHELDREGQVFYLYNRIETIQEFKAQLQKNHSKCKNCNRSRANG